MSKKRLFTLLVIAALVGGTYLIVSGVRRGAYERRRDHDTIARLEAIQHDTDQTLAIILRYTNPKLQQAQLDAFYKRLHEEIQADFGSLKVTIDQIPSERVVTVTRTVPGPTRTVCRDRHGRPC